MTRLLLALLLIAFVSPVEARTARSRETVREFERTHPCPTPGPGTCAAKGWIVDHIVPLCANGPDSPENMQYQRKDDAAAKDKLEWAECRALKK
jgi:hypothetical protein